MPNPTPADVNEHVLASVTEEISELQPTLQNLALVAGVKAALQQLRTGLAALAGSTQLVTSLDAIITEIPGSDGVLSDFGRVLVDLYAFQQAVLNGPLSPSDRDAAQSVLLGAISQVRQLLSYRPDVSAILDDLTAIKALRGGPADATAFHDFNVLQIAFRSVWMHAFSDNLKIAAQELYEQTVRLYDDAGLVVPDFESISDVNSLRSFMQGLGYAKSASCMSTPAPITTAFGAAAASYAYLSPEQQAFLLDLANKIADASTSDADRRAAQAAGLTILSEPLGTGGRLEKLVSEIGTMLSEPYAFDVFAPDSFNYGLMVTYRQRWEPGEYQAGDLVATIPLAPGESRKVTTRRVVKTSRAQKEVERSMSSRSLQSSEIGRAEAEIVQKASTATNFKVTASGSFNIGIGEIGSTSEFSQNQDLQSTQSKRDFHEATLKAAEEYRQEHSMEVDTTSSVETEVTTSGEISNPNNEITVTYLYYELQRRYQVREFLYRVRPVILVAQDVPAPHEIDEAWLIQNQWIINRVLLDDSLRPALQYLTSGFAGDEVSVDVLRAQWEKQKDLVTLLEATVTNAISMRDVMREKLVAEKEEEDKLPTMPGALKVFTFGMDPSEGARGVLDAALKAGQTRLQYVEEALADAQQKLKDASATFAQVTKDYTVALQNMYSRHIAIDQLRMHVKQNIFFYMQAIWDHEPPDQRFFRLYNKKVICPQPEADGPVRVLPNPRAMVGGALSVIFTNVAVPGLGGAVGGYEHELIEVADLDNPLGYKGNYIIFPLKDDCYLTRYMLTNFMDNYLGALDPDGTDDFDAEGFEEAWKASQPGSPERATLQQQLTTYVSETRRTTDEIIVPTRQLFVEALPGAHPLIEDFKIAHRALDVSKVRAEVRHAELENLRLAARLAGAQADPALLEDPDIEKKVLVEGGASVSVGTE